MVKPPTSGGLYEKQIFNVVKNTFINGAKFNTQQETDLGGSKSCNDLECNYSEKLIGIEVKKCNTPDWMQSSIKYDNGRWSPTKKSKIPAKCREIFSNMLTNLKLYDGDIPPFMERKITHKEWLDIKTKSRKWDDVYMYIPDDTITKLYREKGCYYIQISDYGLYHLGEDICNFEVPEFKIEQRIRIRTKVHAKKNKRGFCVLSVIAACQPINIKTLQKSVFSLDNNENLPHNLIFNSCT
jgi:hypothetical protein